MSRALAIAAAEQRLLHRERALAERVERLVGRAHQAVHRPRPRWWVPVALAAGALVVAAVVVQGLRAARRHGGRGARGPGTPPFTRAAHPQLRSAWRPRRLSLHHLSGRLGGAMRWAMVVWPVLAPLLVPAKVEGEGEGEGEPQRDPRRAVDRDAHLEEAPPWPTS